jgi:hypothetical protein
MRGVIKHENSIFKKYVQFLKKIKSGLIELLPDWQSNPILRISYKNVLLKGLQLYLFRNFFK